MTVKELQHLAAAMAHEVRNPLNSMAIHVELLEGRMRKEGVGAEILKSLTVLAAEIDRIDKILEQYLGYAGPTEAARQPVPARALLASVVERVRGEAEQRGVTVELVDGAGPATQSGRSTPTRSPRRSWPWRRTRWRRRPRAATVAIAARTDEDDRAGGGDHHRRRSAHRAGRGGQGVPHRLGEEPKGGVGLTVAKQIVKGHGGSITVKPQASGNLFTIRLPLEVDL